MSEDKTMAYAGYCSVCGTLRAVTVDRPEYAKHVAADVADFIRGGLRVERVTCESVRDGSAGTLDDHAPGCTTSSAKRERKQAANA